MCGRLNQLELFAWAGIKLKLNRRKKKQREDKRSERGFRYNICPTDYADVVTMENGGDDVEVEKMRFGLIPSWAKGSKPEVWKKFMLTFNARSESVFDLSSYRGPIRRQRCLVPVCGWHEWPDRTTPYYIHRVDNEPLLLAGIWDCWDSSDPADEETGAVVTSMSVITTPPGRYMAKFHDRSPLVLEGERALEWLQPGLEKEDIQDFLRPYDSDQLEAYRVSTVVNKATNKNEEVIQAIEPPVPQD